MLPGSFSVRLFVFVASAGFAVVVGFVVVVVVVEVYTDGDFEVVGITVEFGFAQDVVGFVVSVAQFYAEGFGDLAPAHLIVVAEMEDVAEGLAGGVGEAMGEGDLAVAHVTAGFELADLIDGDRDVEDAEDEIGQRGLGGVFDYDDGGGGYNRGEAGKTGGGEGEEGEEGGDFQLIRQCC